MLTGNVILLSTHEPVLGKVRVVVFEPMLVINACIVAVVSVTPSHTTPAAANGDKSAKLCGIVINVASPLCTIWLTAVPFGIIGIRYNCSHFMRRAYCIGVAPEEAYPAQVYWMFVAAFA
jgi:hypothetical protein